MTKWRKLTELFNISSQVADSKYGSQLPNGSWNGMIGDLINKVKLVKTSCKNWTSVLKINIFKHQMQFKSTAGGKFKESHNSER